MSIPVSDGDFFPVEDDMMEEDPPDADSDDEVLDLRDADSDGEVFADGSIDIFTGHSDEADDSTHVFTGHSDELCTVACSPSDPTLVVTGAEDDKGFLWKIDQEDWPFELHGHKDTVSSVAFSYDGQLVASGGYDGVIKVWDISSKSLKCTLNGPGADIEWVRWHPQGHRIVAGLLDKTVWMWDANKNTYLLGHASKVTCGDFTPDGKKICTGSKDKSLRVWDGRTGEKIHVVKGHSYHTEGLTCLAITADSNRVLTGSKDGSVYIVHLATGKVVSSLMSHSRSIEGVGFSASGHWAATGSLDGKLIIWELQHSDLQHPFPRCICEHEKGVTCLSWLGATRFVATGCADGNVRIWDGLSGHCVKTLRGHTGIIHSIRVSADGNNLVSVSFDWTARVFKIDEFHSR